MMQIHQTTRLWFREVAGNLWFVLGGIFTVVFSAAVLIGYLTRK